ncbi:MAG: aminopeptidase P family N-terminal domain-containing protein, partial [Pseudomonadota bacterium]
MFQSFEVATRPEDGPPRLARLRDVMAAEGLAGFLVPRADAHQGEYVAPCDERLAWLTGFTGSAGFAAILSDVAGVFVDGRYRVQIKAQVASAFSPVDWPETKLGPWLIDHLPQGGEVGFDPWLHTRSEMKGLVRALAGTDVLLRPVTNLVDRVWPDRPAPPSGKAMAHPIELAGKKSGEKREEIAKG